VFNQRSPAGRPRDDELAARFSPALRTSDGPAVQFELTHDREVGGRFRTRPSLRRSGCRRPVAVCQRGAQRGDEDADTLRRAGIMVSQVLRHLPFVGA
jgi:hypothetical protein